MDWYLKKNSKCLKKIVFKRKPKAWKSFGKKIKKKSRRKVEKYVGRKKTCEKILQEELIVF